MKARGQAESPDLKRIVNGSSDKCEEACQPRTALGRRLMSIRAKIIASGEPLLNWEEIEKEVTEGRGEAK